MLGPGPRAWVECVKSAEAVIAKSLFVVAEVEASHQTLLLTRASSSKHNNRALDGCVGSLNPEP